MDESPDSPADDQELGVEIPIPTGEPLVDLDSITTRSGFVAFAGRPNAGKSTLTNALVGAKVAITSDKPQTTRRAIRGVLTRDDAQLVLVDLPGVQRPLDSLTGRMQKRVQSEMRDADIALMVINGEEGVGPGDRYIASQLRDLHVPVVIAVNKVDRLHRPATVSVLVAAAELEVSEDVFPISARTGKGVQPLLDHLVTLLPRGPFYFPIDEHSDQPQHVLLAELIREQVLRRTFQEVPHAVEVAIEELDRPRADLTVIVANAWVESPSQKGILIGAGGRMIRNVGTAARKELERELGTKVHLDLQVKVRRNWRSDDSALDRLEID
ncbi:GTP-binding protein Era [Patulibacter medicamentivorans]|uniref:GTPase Era n=1 Tax=Patulibacter medicamentivorans TaxID=1097667 RepID=H0E6K9_9ACTN|nr:GTPase Era [Patulibacter medicamentivorans]EHN10708.1 GTP-binding protein Era [Patulibacter medicamentivorans]